MSKEKTLDGAAGTHNAARRVDPPLGSFHDVPIESRIAGFGGQILLDSALNIVAIDEQARGLGSVERLVTSAPFFQARKRVLDEEPMIQFSVPVSEFAEGPGGDDERTIQVRMNRLDGVAGPVLLVTLSGSDSATSHLDPLTGLPNRRAVGDCLEAWRLAGNGPAARFAVLFLDLDDFKAVNDSHGHAVGDAALKALATRWQECVRDGDLVARYGGDEFVILLRGAATEAEVEPVIRRLQDATGQPILVGSLTLKLAATIGWAAPESSDWTVDALVAAADGDMYARKRQPSR